jgi:hypothetical protein
MSIVLPTSVNYKESLPTLPEGTQQINVSANPVNGQTFTAGQQIYFDLLNRGFLVPDSMYIAYNYALTSAANAEIIGCPVYTSFSRLDVQIGSQIVDSMLNYNVMMNMLTNLTLSVSEKYGLQSSFGYFKDTAVPTLEQLDGRQCTLNESNDFAGPLPSILSNSEKLIPLFAMPQVRIILTVDSISNMFTSTVVPTGWTLSNVELRYKVIDMGGNVEEIIRGMGEKIYIKSQSFASSTNVLAGGTAAGAYDLIYNQRFASVKSIFAIMGGGAGGSNKQFDSFDLTQGTGDYSFNIGGVQYPQRPLSARVNRSGVMQELRTAVGSIFDKNNSFSINSIEWEYGAGTASNSTYSAPGKFYVGTSTEKLNSNSLLTGISTQNSPISFRINTGVNIGANASTVTLVINYDALIEVDLINRQCSVKA